MDKQRQIHELPLRGRFLALAMLFCCSGRASDVPLKNCEVVSVPQQWRIQDVELTHVNRETPTHAESDDVFELRSSGDKFFLAVKSRYAEGILGVEVYSENKFQFTPGKPTVLAPISDEQWRSAKDDVVSTKDPRQVDPSSQSEVTYQGKQLRFSGEHLSLISDSSGNSAASELLGEKLLAQSF